MMFTTHKEAFEEVLYLSLDQLDPDVSQSLEDWAKDLRQVLDRMIEEVGE